MVGIDVCCPVGADSCIGAGGVNTTRPTGYPAYLYPTPPPPPPCTAALGNCRDTGLCCDSGYSCFEKAAGGYAQCRT
eukprot:1473036-Prymnesium_polylepis.1